MDDPLAGLVEAVQAGGKYRHVSPDLVLQLAAQEADKGRSLKETVKAIRNRLHQVGGAYQEAGMTYPRWLADLTIASLQGPDELRAATRTVMRHHASTRERLPILNQFYRETLAGLPPLKSVLDIACGLNPLAANLLPLASGAIYYACDIYADLTNFLTYALPRLGVQVQATVCDVTQVVPSQPVDLALVLKTIPCLEQIDRAAGQRLLDGLNATYLLVSFPTRSLGGRGKGMAATYAAHFQELVAGRNWLIRRFDFDGEMAFLVQKVNSEK